MYVAVDIGGTFTDLGALDPQTGRTQFRKVLNRPDDLVRGIVEGLGAMGVDLAEVDLFVHGSTVVINALLERRGAETYLVTNRGFRDIYEIGRINRPQSFNLRFRKHVPLVPRERVLEVDVRRRVDGTVEKPLDTKQAEDVARSLQRDGAEAIAIVLLHSYRAPDEERQLADIIRQQNPDAFITISSDISREYREFERTSTTAANAYVGPKVSAYLGSLSSSLAARGFAGELLLMQSNGGLFDVESALEQCIQMIESGPAGGVRATVEVAQKLGIGNAIFFDMGGTTAKACVVSNFEPDLSPDYFVGGYAEGLPIRVPVLDIVEIGTGGGSIAWLDEVGGLHVGPRSAGANPGPAAYDNGGQEPTVTDAHVALGHLDPERFLDGRMRLNRQAAEDAIAKFIGGPLNLSVTEAAQGIVEIATAAMANAIRAITTERGLDPRDFTLVAGGGAGPLHVVDVAAELGIATVVIPHAPGTFSALGMLAADLRRDYVLTQPMRLEDLDPGELEAAYAGIEAVGTQAVDPAGQHAAQVRLDRFADLRYVGQEHAVTVPAAATIGSPESLAQIAANFHREHGLKYGHSSENEPSEIVSLRVSARRMTPPFPWPEPIAHVDGNAAPARRTAAALTGTPELRQVDVFDRIDLAPGQRVAGPALVQEAGSCLCLSKGASLRCDEWQNLIVEVS